MIWWSGWLDSPPQPQSAKFQSPYHLQGVNAGFQVLPPVTVYESLCSNYFSIYLFTRGTRKAPAVKTSKRPSIAANARVPPGLPGNLYQRDC
jgi:hypothetical protein